ncbi:murein L,D-transpeptidase family protein [Phaeovulum sp.]|uniref:L,D-transpeptidase family protein n=1 Tax=Phaeovulum sp. TaxID=2934796 RepID=UPI003562FB65
MISRRALIGLSLASVFAARGAAAEAAKIRPYFGPPVTQLQVFKAKRKLYVISGQEVIKTYRIALGGNTEGPKQWEGDSRTPEGTYEIDFRNPNSAFHLSLRISYPNANDVAAAKAMGRKPGGDIFIHGGGGGAFLPWFQRDWTAGCIAVKDEEIEELYAMVQLGTPIFLFA